MVKPVCCWTLVIAMSIAIAVLALKYQAGFAAMLIFGLLVAVHYATKRKKPPHKRLPRWRHGYNYPRTRDRRPV